jgi:hypothetical protein
MTDGQESKRVVVFCAMRAGVCGYFETQEEIPNGWKLAGTQDITEIMGYRHTVQSALKMMNQHWNS